MSIVYQRVDGRMIHGQVASIFAKYYEVDEIIVVNDTAAKDEDQIMLLELAVPFGCEFRVLSCIDAAQCFNENNFYGDRTMVVYKNVQDALNVVNNGYHIEQLYIGGMYNAPGKIEKNVALYVDDNDLQCFRALENSGTELLYQVTSDNKITKLSKQINY